MRWLREQKELTIREVPLSSNAKEKHKDLREVKKEVLYLSTPLEDPLGVKQFLRRKKMQDEEIGT